MYSKQSSFFNVITAINESIILTKHTSCEYRCKFDGTKLNQWWNNNKCWSECKKNILYVKKNMLRILLYVFVKMENI